MNAPISIDGDIERPATVAESVAAVLREAIADGRCPPGSALRQDDLARRFGFSRMPIRDALRLLESEGMVAIHPTRGAFAAGLDVDEIREVYAIRVLLESEALRLAAPHLTAARLDAAERLLEAMEAEPRVGEWGRLNRDFHLALIASCGNGRLIDLIERQHRPCDRYARILLADLDHQSTSQAEHRAVVAALRAGDTETAVALLRRHLEIGAAMLIDAARASPMVGPRGSTHRTDEDRR